VFDAALEQDINRLLEYFACRMPKLALLSKYEQEEEMRKIEKRNDEVERCALRAHCSSIKELQCVASEVKEILGITRNRVRNEREEREKVALRARNSSCMS
jgi:hypothetical protein